VRDVIETGHSTLLLGRPGVGKTTLLREAARVLADELGKRVVVVDTSNEIAGDGDIPHPGIGRARRMQVPAPTEQHAVMIEAVENHMPEVIVIDEIGTQAEALAARTIAERGVQLIATAHGNTLDNLLAESHALRPRRRHPGGDSLRRGGAPARHSEDGPRAQARPRPSTCWSRSRRRTASPCTATSPRWSTERYAACEWSPKSACAAPTARSLSSRRARVRAHRAPPHARRPPSPRAADGAICASSPTRSLPRACSARSATCACRRWSSTGSPTPIAW
jgi:nucleoside-triphosphatase THEP1